MKKYALFTLTILLAAALHVKALTIYNTKYNNFGSINHNQASNINDDFLQLNNKTSSNIIVTLAIAPAVQ